MDYGLRNDPIRPRTAPRPNATRHTEESASERSRDGTTAACGEGRLASRRDHTEMISAAAESSCASPGFTVG